MKKKELTHLEVARKGGLSTKKKYGIKHFINLQKKSVEIRKLNNENRRKDL